MARIAASIAALTALALSAMPASAGVPSLPEETVKGRIVDITCSGPCVSTNNRSPFKGEADVVITDKKTGSQIARASVQGPKYSILAPPGRYRIVAIPYPQEPTICWLSHPRRLHVVAGQSERRTLRVENGCVQ